MNFIPLSYLIACAMVQLSRTVLSWYELNEFATICNRKFSKKHINARFYFSGNPISYITTECTDVFEPTEDGKSVQVMVSNDELISRYLDFMSVDTLLVVQSIKRLCVA